MLSDLVPNTGSSKRKKVFGRSPETNGSPFQENGDGGKDTVSTPISFTSTKRSSVDESTPPRSHRRAKRSIDNAKPADRLSLFGTTFGGSLGKSRKPAPRYSTGYVFVEILPRSVLTGSNEIVLRIKRMMGHPESWKGRNLRQRLRLRSPGCTTLGTGSHRSQSITL